MYIRAYVGNALSGSTSLSALINVGDSRVNGMAVAVSNFNAAATNHGSDGPGIRLCPPMLFRQARSVAYMPQWRYNFSLVRFWMFRRRGAAARNKLGWRPVQAGICARGIAKRMSKCSARSTPHPHQGIFDILLQNTPRLRACCHIF
ncbi:MAG: hypothetical protein HKL95_11700 [Phycisphaerae bacterium]|nr:hypothetical protein [Phycisphaerae bacterium]